MLTSVTLGAGMNERLNALLQKQTAKPAFPGAALAVFRVADGYAYSASAGNLAQAHPFFIASTTKIYLTAILLQMSEQGKLSLDDPLTKHLPETEGLHRYNGRDYSNTLTLRHLMAHTSGLPDYFQQKFAGTSLMGRLLKGEDQSWTYGDALEWTKAMPAKFPPETGRKAYYSDSNYQILGRVIELIEGADISEVFHRRIFAPLGLEHTYLYANAEDRTPQDVNYKNAPLTIRKAMASFRADGGIVSTAPEMMVFLRAFFEGELFDPTVLTGLYNWRKVMFPLQYGSGVMLFSTPRVFSPFKKQPDLMGHSGLSGAFSFFAPSKGIYLAGTVNQIAHPGASFQLMLKVLAAL